MRALETPLAGVLVFELETFADPRGFLLERHRQAEYAAAGVARPFVQDNHCRSVRGSLRGLHFQYAAPQDKLIDVTRGAIWDVVVDVRRGSQTWGRWHAVTLDDETHRQIYIPSGFAHGFCVLSDVADIQYKMTDYFRPAQYGGIVWDDPDLAIEWPISSPTLSEQDRRLRRLRDIPADALPPFDPLDVRAQG